MKINKSKSYLLPLISDDVKLEYINELVNTYTYVEGFSDEIIGLLYNFQPDYNFFKNKYQGFIIYEEYLFNHPLYIDKIDVDNKVLYIFKIPEKYSYDYNKFIRGKYSEIREENKFKILNFLTSKFKGNQKIINDIEGILFKNPEIKHNLEKKLAVTISDSSELSSIIDKNVETFEVSNFKTVKPNE